MLGLAMVDEKFEYSVGIGDCRKRCFIDGEPTIIACNKWMEMSGEKQIMNESGRGNGRFSSFTQAPCWQHYSRHSSSAPHGPFQAACPPMPILRNVGKESD